MNTLEIGGIVLLGIVLLGGGIYKFSKKNIDPDEGTTVTYHGGKKTIKKIKKPRNLKKSRK